MVTFTARRIKAEVVVPARATPREVKPLSDIDNMPELRLYATLIEFFQCRVAVPGEQPARSLKAALAEALVHYYPVAGRLRELPGAGGKRKLAVDCTAEGVVFVEARADVRLEELGTPLVPPYPCVDQFLCDVGDPRAIIGTPLLYLQMTRLSCGGLVLALTMCHSLVDAFGMRQLLTSVLDLARGLPLPSVLPVWERHFVTSKLDEAASAATTAAKPAAAPSSLTPLADQMVTRFFLFGPREIAAIRAVIPARLGRSATVFELITAAMWRCRVAALQHAPGDRVCALFVANARGAWKRDPPLPRGFYGNAMFPVTTDQCAAGELSLARALGLLREAKLRLTDAHVRSVVDLMARGEHRMEVALNGTFMVSDITRCGDDSAGLGWAERVAGGAPVAEDISASAVSLYISCKNADGEASVSVPMCLPRPAMARFTSLIHAITSEAPARSSL